MENSKEIQNAANTLEKLSHAAGNQVGTIVSQTSEKASTYLKKTRGYVEENPVQSVAIAAATGLLIGGLLVLATRSRQ